MAWVVPVMLLMVMCVCVIILGGGGYVGVVGNSDVIDVGVVIVLLC